VATVTLRDFQPYNTWRIQDSGQRYDGGEPVFYHLDMSSDKIYSYQSPKCLRYKCVALLLWTVIAHVIKIAKRVFDVATLYCFCSHDDHSRSRYSLKERVTNLIQDPLKTLATPLLVILLEISAFYGVFNPFDGRKLYATVERAAYQWFGMEGVDIFCRPDRPYYCAPCFQPGQEIRHALGGDPNKPEAW